MIPKLVDLEQSDFLSGHSTFDNIIATQEITHSTEVEASTPLRMIAKVDIDKAFDTVEWKTILATL